MTAARHGANRSSRIASRQIAATASGDSTPSPDATPPVIDGSSSRSPTKSGLLTMMFVATACGHSTDTRMPWWWCVTASHSARETAAALVIEYDIDPIWVSNPAADAVFDAGYAWSVFEHLDDVSGTLRELRRTLAARGTTLYLCRMKLPVWRLLERAGVPAEFGENRCFRTERQAIAALTGENPAPDAADRPHP